jgi:hypothetical protein
MKRKLLFLIPLIAVLFVTNNVSAHCDHIDGPVVADARIALDRNDITPVLKWIYKADEAELTAVFEKTMRVRKAGGETQELADRMFFETLVRLHRASEGAPFTGLKPAGTPVAGYVTLSDHALETGSAEELIVHLQEALEHVVSGKFEETYTKKLRVTESVEAGRAYIHDYVDFVHYVKYVVETIKGTGQAHHGH